MPLHRTTGLRPVQMQPIGRFYLIQSCHKGTTYLMEADDLPFGKDQSDEECITLLSSFDDAEAVFAASEEGNYFRNVSHEIAETWLNKLVDTFNPHEDEWPAFIQRHISPLRLEETEADILASIERDRRDRRALSSPEAMGRV